MYEFPFYLISTVGSLLKSKTTQAYSHHLVLAQQFMEVENEQEQRTLALAVNPAGKTNRRIILDNGAYEGKDVDLDDYLFIIDLLAPHVIVLPDMVHRRASVSRNYSLSFKKRVKDCVRASVYSPEYMYVPQGRDVCDNLNEYWWAMDNMPSGTLLGLGLSYKLWSTDDELQIGSEYGRLRLLSALSHHTRFNDFRFHVLGARWHPTRSYSCFTNIVGIDTFKPARCALAGVIYPMARPGEVKGWTQHHSARVDDTLLLQNIQSFCYHYGCKSMYGDNSCEAGS
jgi:hypothetical protein